jgi:hypothetical protein
MSSKRLRPGLSSSLDRVREWIDSSELPHRGFAIGRADPDAPA